MAKKLWTGSFNLKFKIREKSFNGNYVKEKSVFIESKKWLSTEESMLKKIIKIVTFALVHLLTALGVKVT